MKPKIKTKIIKTICHDEMSEMDFILYDEMFGAKVVEKIYEGTSVDDHPSKYIIDKQQNSEQPVKIDSVIKMLNSLKERGCDYVSMFYHTDHIGYNFEGISITDATEEEIQEQQNRLTAAKELKAKMSDLENQHKELQTKYTKLNAS